MDDKWRNLRLGLGALGLILLVVGAWMGLFWAPPDREMGDVYRIIYTHVPAMWMTLIGGLINFIACVAYLIRANWKADSVAEASAEVGLMFGVFGLVLGMLWGKPTWGVYWDWDPRLTAMAVLLVAYMGYMTLRRFIEDPEKRAVWSAVVGIIAFMDIPIVWFSVRWWRSLHQVQSTPQTVHPDMTLALRVNAFAMLFLFLAFVWSRYRIAMANRKEELALPEALGEPTPALS